MRTHAHMCVRMYVRTCYVRATHVLRTNYSRTTHVRSLCVVCVRTYVAYVRTAVLSIRACAYAQCVRTLRQCFFFPVTFFGLPVTLFEKCPWFWKNARDKKTPNFARENWLVARDKKAKKLPVKNEKWPWHFLQICKSARDNFWFLPLTKQKVSVTKQLFFPKF